MMRTKELFRKTGRVAARFFLCLGTLLIGGFALLMGALAVDVYKRQELFRLCAVP